MHRALDQEQPDVVLLDMKLPDANGLGLLPAIKQRWPATEVIMLSGAPNDSGAVLGGRGGQKWRFRLPLEIRGIQFPHILACVSSALERRCQAQGSET